MFISGDKETFQDFFDNLFTAKEKREFFIDQTKNKRGHLQM